MYFRLLCIHYTNFFIVKLLTMKESIVKLEDQDSPKPSPSYSNAEIMTHSIYVTQTDSTIFAA